MAPSFGPGSCARHEALARSAGAAVQVVEVPSLAFDVDTPADLAALRLAA
jgi:2-phospho-L-lactate guanylyltransferase